MNVNYKSDFKVRVQPTLGGEPIDITGHDFDLVFTTSGGARKYVCSKRGEVLTNCTIEGTAIACVFDNHRLPCGVLQVAVYDYAPDVTYPDGNELTVTPSALDVTLVVGAGDGSAVSGEVVVDVSAAIANANMAADAARSAAERAEAAADEVDVVIGRASGYADAAAESATAAAAAAHQAQAECEGAHGYMVNAKAFADNAAASASQVASALDNYYTKSEDNALLAGKADKPLTVNITSEEIEGETVYHADKTTAEIYAAVLAGRNVVAHHDTYEFMLDAVEANIALFSWSYLGSV